MPEPSVAATALAKLTTGFGFPSVELVVYTKLVGHLVNVGGSVSVMFTVKVHHEARPALFATEQFTVDTPSPKLVPELGEHLNVF